MTAMTTPKPGHVRAVMYAGHPYEATVIRVTPRRYLGRFVTGTGPKCRWFYWKGRYGGLAPTAGTDIGPQEVR
jgi:hypothetical protein